MDVTDYLDLYRLSARELGLRIMSDIYRTTGIRATCGVGTNLYLAKVALDITAKHAEDFIGELDENGYRTQLWNHRPLTDFWRIGSGTARRLEPYGIRTMRDIAEADEDFLYRLFGIDAELLIDHAWGREPVTMTDIKSYRSHTNCLGSGQVLGSDYPYEKGLLVGNYLADLAANKKFANQDGPVLLKGFENRTLGASFTGTWDAELIKGYLGDDYGVTTLPEVTLEDGSTIQLASMMNFNLTGVNAQTKYPAEAMLLAEYLTNSESALKTRYELRPGSSTNKLMEETIAADADNEALQALTDQSKLSIMQTSIPQVANFWSPAEAFGAGLMNQTITRDNMQESLDKMVQNTLSKLG